MTPASPGSPSIATPDYWWYRARAELLRTVLSSYVGEPRRVLDVGSADGPSVGWLRTQAQHVALDVDPRGLAAGGVCGSALALPFESESFDVVAAFDVVEHCAPEGDALAELERVLAPGGRLLLSVPAYTWAWTRFDDANGHHRRYTRPRAVHAVENSGLVVQRATYAFAAMFPLFAADRIRRKLADRAVPPPSIQIGGTPRLPEVSSSLERLLLRLARFDQWMLASRDLPFGSSVLIAAIKPGPLTLPRHLAGWSSQARSSTT